eukprot:1618887-Pyramimonas_sp.AAC.1
MWRWEKQFYQHYGTEWAVAWDSKRWRESQEHWLYGVKSYFGGFTKKAKKDPDHNWTMLSFKHYALLASEMSFL